MPKIVVSLTDSKIRSAISQHKKAPDKAIKLSDGGGLYLLIDKKGGTYWRYDYVRPITKDQRLVLVFIQLLAWQMHAVYVKNLKN